MTTYARVLLTAVYRRAAPANVYRRAGVVLYRRAKTAA